jgi:predicted aspartyl protease
VRLTVADVEDEVLVLVDTGFNGQILMTAADAIALQVRRTKTQLKVELGDGVARSVNSGVTSVTWLGKIIEVEILIVDDAANHASPDEPTILLGTRLLSPHLLLIDFTAGTVEIEAQ